MVFGRAISGQAIVREIEDLEVDGQSRPVMKVVVANCGELVHQSKSRGE